MTVSKRKLAILMVSAMLVTTGTFAQAPKIDPLVQRVFSFLSHELGIAPGSHALIIGLYFQLESCSAVGVPFGSVSANTASGLK